MLFDWLIIDAVETTETDCDQWSTSDIKWVTICFAVDFVNPAPNFWINFGAFP